MAVCISQCIGKEILGKISVVLPYAYYGRTLACVVFDHICSAIREKTT